MVMCIEEIYVLDKTQKNVLHFLRRQDLDILDSTLAFWSRKHPWEIIAKCIQYWRKSGTKNNLKYIEKFLKSYKTFESNQRLNKDYMQELCKKNTNLNLKLEENCVILHTKDGDRCLDWNKPHQLFLQTIYEFLNL